MIETQEIALHGRPGTHEHIQNLTAFGWQPTQVSSRRSGRSSYSVQIMARETTMPHYNDYRRLEEVYTAARYRLKTYEPMEASKVLLLLLIFIFPGVIYISYKSKQKADIKAHNEKCYEEMNKAIELAKQIK